MAHLILKLLIRDVSILVYHEEEIWIRSFYIITMLLSWALLSLIEVALDKAISKMLCNANENVDANLF